MKKRLSIIQKYLGSSNRIKVLEHFWIGQELPYTMKDVCNSTKLTIQEVRKEINSLLKLGFLRLSKRKYKRMNLYFVNKKKHSNKILLMGLTDIIFGLSMKDLK